MWLAGLTTTFATALLIAATQDPAKPTQFTEIDVQRINLREPDGTLRLVLASKGRFPGDFLRGKENPRPDRQHAAGMLFLNDEGTEAGGLIYAGREVGGRAKAGMSLTFDRFRQDQVLQLLHQEGDGRASAGVVISDRPDGLTYPIDALKADVAAIEALPENQRGARWDALAKDGRLGNPRVFLGTTRDQGAALVLSDGSGRPRMMLMVTTAGEPRLQVLDEAGRVSGTFAIVPVAAEGK